MRRVSWTVARSLLNRHSVCCLSLQGSRAILTEHATPKDMRLDIAAETNSNLEIVAEEIGEQGLTDQAKSSLLKRIPVP